VSAEDDTDNSGGEAPWQLIFPLHIIEGLSERTEYLDIFLFLPITQLCSVSDVLCTVGREVSDFSVLKY